MELSTQLATLLAATCGLSALLGFAGWWRPGSRLLSRAAIGASLVALLLSVATWAARVWLAGHLPVFGTYESALSLALAVLLAAAIVWLRHPGRIGIWPVACGVAGLLTAHGLRFDTTIFALTISERSWVVDVHAVLAWSAFAALTVNAGLAAGRLVGRFASPRAERLLERSLELGFVLHSAMLASGSLYKFLLFGDVWSFDPVETLGFAAWIAYGTLLHMQLFAGWQGRRLAAWCLALFVLLVVSYRGIVYFPAWSTYHIFDMNLRIHVTGEPSPDAGETP